MNERDSEGKFAKGYSGNPQGRPKGSVSINDTIRRFLDMKVKDVDPALIAQVAGKDKLFARKYGNKKLHEALAIAYIREGLKGDFRLLEQMEGKPRQQVDVDANIRSRGEMIVIDASGKPIEDDESPNK